MARFQNIDDALQHPDDCTELFCLDFDTNHKKMKALPAAFGKLKKLEKLLIAELPNDFSFPDEMGELASLKLLSLPSLPWKTLPEWLFRLANLESFRMVGEFTALPEELTRLKKLRELSLWSQHWRGYPEVICKLVKLTKLTLNGTKFYELPESFDNLVELHELELEQIGLSNLPPSLAKMKKLTRLSLAGNELTELPATIGDMTSLTELDVGGNRLTTLPRSIGKLFKLEMLQVQGNQIAALPAEIGKLGSLSELNLRGNALTDLPPSMSKLSKLKKLDLSQNPLTLLPEGVCAIPNLENLRLGSQRGSAGTPIGPVLTLPSAIGKLKKLRILDANDGYFESLPLEIGKLTRLSMMYLRGNRLRDVPPEMGNLAKLKYLALEDNLLTSLPGTLAGCKELRELNLTGNTFPPDEIAKLKQLNEQLPDCDLRLPREVQKKKKKTAKASHARLTAALMTQLNRLGAKLKSPEKIPVPKTVKIGNDEYLWPEALRQLDQDVDWRRQSYKGELNNFEMWNVAFGGVSSEPLDEYECVHHGGYALLGTIDSGNMMLLVNLEDKAPEDPMTYWLDHEEFDTHKPSEFARFSKLLSKLTREE